MTEVKITIVKLPIDTLIKIKAIALEKEYSKQHYQWSYNKGLKNTEDIKGKIKAELLNRKYFFINLKKASLNNIISIRKIK